MQASRSWRARGRDISDSRQAEHDFASLDQQPLPQRSDSRGVIGVRPKYSSSSMAAKFLRPSHQQPRTSPNSSASSQSIRTHILGWRHSDTCAMSLLDTNWAVLPEARCPPLSSNTLNENSSLISTSYDSECSGVTEKSVATEADTVATRQQCAHRRREFNSNFC